MLNIKHNILKIVMLLLIVFLLLISNFFNNIQNIYINNFDKRIDAIYGFCKNESIGYLKYIKKKYELDNNPKIINYIHTPNVNWIMMNPKKLNFNSKNLILLNYPGENINLNYSILFNNTYEVANLYFYEDKIDQIDNITFYFREKIKQDFSLQLFSNSKLNHKKLLKKITNGNIITENKYKFNLNLNLEKIGLKENSLIFKIDNPNNVPIKEIKISAKNKININDFRLIDHYQKCYVLEKI